MAEAGYRRPGVEILPLSKETLQDRVYRQIASLILEGGIVPGEMVPVQSLADAFGVSAMPVREALHRLVAEKALTVVAGRSVGIPPLNIDRLEDLTRARIEIEGVATEWAAHVISAADLAKLDDLIATMEAAQAAGDGKRYVPANRDFHFTVYRAAGSETLLSIIESLWLRIGPYFDLLNAAGGLRASNAEHRRIRDALGRGDGMEARTALKADIEGAAKTLRTLLP
jgi:DNA-binding GntR family transcriptional regulator